MPKQFLFIMNFVRVYTEMIWISDRLEMTFSVSFDFTTITKLILIIHCMLLLAAALHSIIMA